MRFKYTINRDISLTYGRPCRFVHISETTLGFLNGDFEVEPAYGERHEDALRNAGLKTYFITKVLKPVSILKSNLKHE